MIKKAIIPVAGMGTRFLPATKAQPKEMLPIVDKPIIQYLVEEAVASGITEIIFVTGRGKRAIEDHFDYAYELEQMLATKGKKELLKTIREISNLASFAYVRQKEPRGDGDALLAAAHLVGDEPCAVLFGDDIVDSTVPCLKQMIPMFEKYNDPVVALEEVKEDETSMYGIVDTTRVGDRMHEIKHIVEKPAPGKAPSRLAIVGKYIITKEVFGELRKLRPKDGEIRLADALKNYLSHNAVYG
ncbi:UTP--glucose-1-phosphate uridylyltransferase, partial [Candidatus Azambacteria bacterium RBG_16_47_10]